MSAKMQTVSQGSDHELPNPVQFVDHQSFASLKLESIKLAAGSSIYSDRELGDPAVIDGCGDFETLRDLPLLSIEGEAFLFKKMNYLRYQAEQLRTNVAWDHAANIRFYRLLEDADAVRNHIAECNLRLVISIARKFSTGGSDFDELMSEGNEILLKAICKFDFSRGFRFSTYATHSVQRHFYRYTQKVKKRNTLEFKSSAEILNELPSAEADASIAEWVQEERRMSALIAEMANRLDEREHHIVVQRFGLNSNGVSRTLRELSADLGLSKERVRQLQLIAVDKLRDLFDELDSRLACI